MRRRPGVHHPREMTLLPLDHGAGLYAVVRHEKHLVHHLTSGTLSECLEFMREKAGG